MKKSLSWIELLEKGFLLVKETTKSYLKRHLEAKFGDTSLGLYRLKMSTFSLYITIIMNFLCKPNQEHSEKVIFFNIISYFNTFLCWYFFEKFFEKCIMTIKSKGIRVFYLALETIWRLDVISSKWMLKFFVPRWIRTRHLPIIPFSVTQMTCVKTAQLSRSNMRIAQVQWHCLWSINTIKLLINYSLRLLPSNYFLC